MGSVFWVNELAIIAALVAFALYPLIWRRLDIRWLYLLGGGLLMLFAHLVLMLAIAGDPLYLFRVVTGQISRSFIHGGAGEDNVWHYFRYLLIDVRHTWGKYPPAEPGALRL
jgi:hypothetical protein